MADECSKKKKNVPEKSEYFCFPSATQSGIIRTECLSYFYV